MTRLLMLGALDPMFQTAIGGAIAAVTAVALIALVVFVFPSRKQEALMVADLAFGAVNEVVRKTENKIDDALVDGLSAAATILRTGGTKAQAGLAEAQRLLGRELSTSEKALVKARFDGLNAQEKKAEDLARPPA